MSSFVAGLLRQSAIPRAAIALAGALSVTTAGIHLQVAPAHFAEWWGYGTFFVVTAVAELALAVALLRHPRGWVLQAGIWGTLATILMFLVSRTKGIPLGPQAGIVEGLDVLGVEATLAEAALLALMCALLEGRARRRTIDALALVGVVVWALAAGGALTPGPQPSGGHNVHSRGKAPLPFIPDSIRNAPRPPGIG